MSRLIKYITRAVANINSGSGNTALGSRAMFNNNAGLDNVAIGYYADMGSTNLSNSIAIGYGATALTNNEVRLGNSSITSLWCMGIYTATTPGAFDVNVNGGGQLMRVSSSRRYKTDITDLEINTSKIYQLRPVSYTGISDKERHFGLIAEEVADVIPELALYAKESQVVPGSKSDKLIPESVRYPFLSVLLLKEVQKHEQRIEQLEKNLAEKDAVLQQVLREIQELKASLQQTASK